ncbi:MAG: DUF3488 and DUF4129 domain-containing transglutaminase family protein, partial [Bradymonadaceae bacterium]
LVGTFSLALFHLKTELHDHASTLFADRVPFDRQYVGVLLAISVMIFASSVGIFFVFPRIGLGYFAQKSRQGMAVSGFSDSVELGSHGTLESDPTVAMRVEFPHGRPTTYRSLHWRTMTFDRWTGTGWKRSFDDSERPIPSTDRTYDLGRFISYPAETTTMQGLPKKVKIYVEPLENDVLPVLWPARRLTFGPATEPQVPDSPSTGSVQADRYGDLTHTVSSDIGVSYTVEPAPRPRESALRQATGPIRPTRELEPYLQLPKGLSPRVRRLARRVAGDADTPYEKAEAMAQHLRENFDYTTDLPDVGDDRPLTHFLFEAKRGHCEYHATALTVMLRTLDIPARMVNGFLGGRWNFVGDYLEVRQEDAHSWVEVWVPRFGWQQIDPTPAGERGPIGSRLLLMMRDSYDAMRLMWMKWVIEYDLHSQIRLLRQLLRAVTPAGAGDAPDESSSEAPSPSQTDGSGGSWSRFFRWLGLVVVALLGFRAGRRYDPRIRPARFGLAAGVAGGSGGLWSTLLAGGGAASLGGGVLVGIAAVLAGSIWTRTGLSGSGPAPTRLYTRIERAARAAGTPRTDGESPGAYLDRLADTHPELERELHLFRRRYLAARFDERPLDADALRSLRRLTATIVARLSPGVFGE